jgi:hypothetical protein
MLNSVIMTGAAILLEDYLHSEKGTKKGSERFYWSLEYSVSPGKPHLEACC